MKWLLVCCIVILGLASARADILEVTVVEPYVDMHSGPASEYPVFHIIEQGQSVAVLKTRTGWYKVRTAKGIEGWIVADDLVMAEIAPGQTVALPEYRFEDYQQRTFEFGVYTGRLDNSNSLSVSAAWAMTQNIVAEVSATQALGEYAENQLWLVRVQHFIFPKWRLSPYMTLGFGQIRTTPDTTLIQGGGESRTSDLMEVGLGARYYLLRNFSARLEYKRLTALTARDDLEELNQWQLGFSVFF
ncbi:SH3 domain-containing protein [Alteromonas aestuariivivens]|uniref:SH3 domain-containing protein n=1 Tax=Alteromonas aestuariivivens TaxID=1938339 RepID=A0A3D8MCD6_9ALTE|nr:SH3 domain-containing protein [Alteromonas aestuariivivens]RDV28178.1 SH3 domain-containing protein [Alteromonas aestuariivivens]